MSKYILKNTVFHIAILIMISILNSCDTDDIEKQHEQQVFIPKNELRIQTKTGSNVSKKVTSYLKQKTNNLLQVHFSKNGISLNKSNLLGKNADFGTINTEKEIVVVNEHNTKHTFKVDNVSQNDNVIVNIVIVETASITYEYFIKYTFEDSIPYDYSTNTIDLSRFTGTIETYTSEGDLSGSMDIEDGEVTQINGQTSPCPDEVTPTDTTNNDNNNNTSSSSNSTGIPGEGSTNNTNQNSTNNTSNSSGGWVQGDGPCGLNYTYVCTNGYGGNHDPTSINSAGDLCSGTNNGAGILTVTDCNGNVLARNNDPTMLIAKGDDTISNPCAGTVGVLITVAEAHQKNCDELKKLLAESDYPIIAPAKTPKSAHEDLEGDLNLTHETGYTLRLNTDKNPVAYKVSNLNYNKVRYPPRSNAYGGMHTHQNNNEIIPMFSGGDVKTLLDFYQQFDVGTPSNNSLFVHVLVTYQGTYAIKIEDLSKLQQLNEIFADEDDANGDGIDELKQFNRRYDTAFRKTYDETTGLFTGGSLDFQKAFLKFSTQKYDLGVSLYKAGEDTNGAITWKKQTLNQVNNNTSVVESTPCPE